MVTVRSDSVEFEFFRPEAAHVLLAGDFNDWQGNLAMVPDGRGYWKARVPLPAGEFKFRYCADGQWFTDYAAFGVEPGRFGLDSIVRVPQQKLRMAERTGLRSAAAA
jgi:1,4-alpha-glucan branching enzyme